MRSLRTRFTILTSFAIMISVLATIVIVGFSVSRYVSNRADDLLRLVCRARQEALDSYFYSIDQSVDIVADYAENDLEESGDDLNAHLGRAEQLFRTVAAETSGTLTYYYRIAPEVAGDSVGFWYQRGEDGSFISSELTEIEKYAPDEVSRVGWYYIPKQTGAPVWMDPYFNDNMGVKMISYVVPIYRDGEFFGVIGMDFSYEDLVAHMEDIDEFDTGYAFLTDGRGSIVYHKDSEAGTLLESVAPEELTEAESNDGDSLIRYSYQGKAKRAACALLENKMRLYVTVSESEINAAMWRMITVMLLSALAILALFIMITSIAVKRITLPLSNLTQAAEAFDRGDYDVNVEYDGNDEIGILTNSFSTMRDHLKSQIGSLNDMAFKDALTSIRNKSAFDSYSAHMDESIRISKGEDAPEFAVCMFDCNDLKEINDNFGHDKGDLYIKKACSLICEVFRHSAVFRTGGDEFIAVLRNADYRNRDELCSVFTEHMSESIDSDAYPWDMVSMAKGLAVFDPAQDSCMADVVRRADELMYAEKARMKHT